MVAFKVNGTAHSLDLEPEMPLLWALRNEIGLTGTKYGCGIGAMRRLHGADGWNGRALLSCCRSRAPRARRSPRSKAFPPMAGRIQVQAAWIAEDVPQCGYCQSGQIMSAIACSNSTPHPDDTDIDAAMAGNICRCGTYVRIRRAIKRAAGIRREADHGRIQICQNH